MASPVCRPGIYEHRRGPGPSRQLGAGLGRAGPDRGAFRAERHGAAIGSPPPCQGRWRRRCWPRAGGTSSIARDFDAFDWWYRCPFAPGRIDPGVPARLRFQGLATRAEVWLNGERILNSDNMFQAHVTDVTAASPGDERPRALFPGAHERRWPRGALVRAGRPGSSAISSCAGIRTSLLGRMPGWSPPVAPVGPWRAISLELWRPGTFTDLSIQPRLEGGTGVVEVSAFAPHAAEAHVAGTLSVGARRRRAARRARAGRLAVVGPASHRRPRALVAAHAWRTPSVPRLGAARRERRGHDSRLRRRGLPGRPDPSGGRRLRPARQRRARVLPGRVLDRG